MGALVFVGAAGAEAQPPHAGHNAPPAERGARDAGVDSLAAMALAVSPAVRAASARVDAAVARVSPSGARPDPMLMAGVQNLPVTRPGFADEMTMAMVGVSQTVSFGGKLSFRRRAAAFAVDAARAELDRVRNTVARDVRIAYYDLAYLDRALALVARNRDALLDLARLAEARYGSGADVAAPAGAGPSLGGPSSAVSAGEPMSLSTLPGAPSVRVSRDASGMSGMAAAPDAGMPLGGMSTDGRSGGMSGPGAANGVRAAAMSSSPMSGTMTQSMRGGRLQEVLRARAEATRLAGDASALSEERRAALASLNALLDRPSETPLDSAVMPARLVRAALPDSAREIRFVSAALGARAADSPLPSLDTLDARAATHSPLIRAHEALIAAQSARAEVARLERRPDVDVAVQYGVRPTRPDMVTATVSLPLPLQRRRVQDMVAAAAGADLAALVAEHHQQLAAHRVEIARLRADAERARTQLALLKVAELPQAHAVLAAGVAAYEAGQVGLGAVLDARAQLFNQETAYYRALSEFAKAVAELELSIGAEVLP